ncbi:MAG: hypothetical protein ACREOC_11650 [Gemmatimonadales bacterium]
MYKLTPDTRAMVLRCLTDGMGVRAVGRLTGASKGAILRLLVEAGTFAEFYQDKVFRDLRTTRVEADEIWSFVGAKQKNATQPGHATYGPSAPLMRSPNWFSRGWWGRGAGRTPKRSSRTWLRASLAVSN